MTGDDVSSEAFPFRTAQTIHDRERGGACAADHVRRRARLRALRRHAVTRCRCGTRSWPRRPPTRWAITALDSLRIEKGYRYFGTDLTAPTRRSRPASASASPSDKRTELDRAPAPRLRTLLVGDEDYLTIYGGEAVQRNDGEVIGRVRSAAYGFTVRRNIALAKLPSELEEGTECRSTSSVSSSPTHRSRCAFPTPGANGPEPRPNQIRSVNLIREFLGGCRSSNS